MKKIAGMLVLLSISSGGFSQEKPNQLLDKIAFQITNKAWVNTKTALLEVMVNATLSNTNLIKARADIMNHLSQIAPAPWHIIAFDRTQDSSGLEKLTIRAQARVDERRLTEVYQNAKKISKPGVSYKISDIEFKPSLDEVQQVRTKLRETLYKEAKEELARINNVYSNQHFSLNRLVFVEPGSNQNQTQPREMMNMAVMTKMPAISVSNELKMTAIVEVAANRADEKPKPDE